MYSVSFVFQLLDYDSEFYRLNDEIETAANSYDSFCGVETWMSEDKKKYNAIYYWNDLEELKDFSRGAYHLEAKKQYKKWYSGFHVVVAEVIKSYGDDALGQQLTPNQRRSA